MVPAMSGPAFSDVRRFETIDSTNRYLMDEARRGAAAGLVAVADHQSAGRGRLGRRWEAPPGSALLASVLLRPELAPDDLYLCTALVALAGADACVETAGVAPELKWPNDLLVGDRKLGGVLAEWDPGAPGGTPSSVAVVVGIGINLDWPGPEGAGGVSLAEVADPPRRDDLLTVLLERVATRYGSLGDEVGRAALAAELQVRCSTVGRRVRVELSAGRLVGQAVGLDACGRLLVDGDDGRRHGIAAGDVVHLRSAAAG